MAKNSITDYSKTAASNTDIQSVDIAEGCLPSGINNAIREIMADLADMNDGTVTLTSPSFAAATITGDLTVDTNTLHVDSTNNRVGIGTTSPSATVDVEGELIVTGGGTGTILVNDEDSSLCPTMTFTRNGGGTSTNDFIKFENSGGEVAAINTSGGAYFSNNVGIGTSSALDLLHLKEANGTATSTQLLLHNDNTGSGSAGVAFSVMADGETTSYAPKGAILFERTATNGRGAFKFMADNFDDTNPFSAADEVMRITPDGKVGIGTSSPVSPLEIATTNKLGSTFTGTTNGEGLTVTQTNYTAGNYVSLVEAAFDDSGDVNPNVRIGAMFDASGSNLAFGTSNSYGSGITNTAMFIDSSGNVGIGTSSPNARLDVVGSSQIRQQYTGASNGFQIGQFNSSGDASINNQANANLLLATNNTERMRITSDGYIQFPVATDAMGNFADNISEVGDGNFALQITNTAQSALKPFGIRAEDIRFATGSSERMRIDSSGQVGIGTTSPSTTLTIDSGGTPTTLKLDSLTESSIDFDDKGGSPKRYKIGTNISSNDGQFEFKDMTANAERMRIDSSGNVTLGAGGTYRLDINAPTSSAAKITCDNTSMEIGTFDNHVVKFLQNNSERMRIDGGNVLVGTTDTSPTSTSEGLQFYKNTGEKTGRINSYQNSSNSSATRIAFYRGTSQIGGITTSSASTAYNTTSDHRLKENVTSITDGIERVKQLNPSRFNFIADADTTVDGFLAHEAATVVPESVTGEKDAVDADGNPEYQGIDQAKLVPLLTAALQEAITKIEDLEARVATLEGN